MVLLMKKILLFLTMIAALTAIIVPAALATTTGVGMPPNVYCLNGTTTALPAPISFGSETRNLGQTTAEAILEDTATFPGGLFYMGYLDGTTTVVLAGPAELQFLAKSPKPSVNTIARGACAAPAAAQPDRHFWLCYSSYQTDPAVYSRARAEALLDEGMWVPYAVKSPVSKTGIGNGVYLTCKIPSGMTPTGAAVSSGGGEAYNAPYAKVPRANKLDWAMLVG
jgi:hypothetical protein